MAGKNAMAAVLEDMGRAARERKARRYTSKPPREKKDVEVRVGEVSFEPHVEGTAKVMDIDPDEHGSAGMSSADMDELTRDLDIQR